MVREGSIQPDPFLLLVLARPDKTVERWRIKAASSKVVQRVDSLEKVKNTESFLSDTCAVAGDVDKADERRTGGNVSWVLYLMLVVLGIVSIGLIVKLIKIKKYMESKKSNRRSRKDRKENNVYSCV